jgi:hypothetical protein
MQLKIKRIWNISDTSDTSDTSVTKDRIPRSAVLLVRQS